VTEKLSITIGDHAIAPPFIISVQRQYVSPHVMQETQRLRSEYVCVCVRGNFTYYIIINAEIIHRLLLLVKLIDCCRACAAAAILPAGIARANVCYRHARLLLRIT